VNGTNRELVAVSLAASRAAVSTRNMKISASNMGGLLTFAPTTAPLDIGRTAADANRCSLALNLHHTTRVLVAKQRAAQCTDLSLKETLKDVARHWLALAERVDWLDRQHTEKKEKDFHFSFLFSANRWPGG
jgi:hypothetical protein